MQARGIDVARYLCLTPGVDPSDEAVEAAHGVTCGALREILYGPPDAEQPFDRMPGMIWSQILEPLCWLALLAGTMSDDRQHFAERVYTTTGLWSEAFLFPLDGQVGLVTLH